MSQKLQNLFHKMFAYWGKEKSETKDGACVCKC
jgi:hypothetical protein